MIDTWTELDPEAAPEELRRRVAKLRGGGCSQCGRPVCGHEALFNIALGFQDAPRCLGCLAGAMDRQADELRDHLFAHLQRRDCYGAVWREASQEEAFAADALPGCLWGDESPVPEMAATPAPLSHGAQAPRPQPPVAAEWNAGDLGCGDLVLELRLRLNALAPGDLFRLTARDPGAPEDVPAWCRLTGHRLVDQRHPEYLIQRKES